MSFGFASRLVLFSFFLSGTSLSAQWRTPTLTPLRATEGLPSVVNRIVMDSAGFIYIASNVGLYRYDGHEFTFYGPDPLNKNSIASGEIRNLMVSRDGVIWMALRFGGLNSFDPKTGIFKRYPLPELSFRTIPTATSLYEDPDGTIWVGATHFRLLAFDRNTETYTLYMPDWMDPEEDRGRLSILSITPHRDHPDTMWLSVLDFKSDLTNNESYSVVIFRKSNGKFIETPLAGQVKYVDPEGIMWASKWGNFIVRMDPATLQKDTFHHHFYLDGQDVKPLTRDITYYDGKVTVASSIGLMSFDRGEFSSILSMDLTDEIHSLYVDPSQNLWIGTNQGIQILDPDDQHIRYFSLGRFGLYSRIFPGRLAHDPVTDILYLSVTQDKRSDGYYMIPLNPNQKHEARYVTTNFPVQGLTVDHNRRLWLAGDGELYSLDLQSKTPAKPVLHSGIDEFLPGIYMETSKDGWIGIIASREFVWFHPDSMKVRTLSLDQLAGSQYAKSFDNGFDGFSFGANHTAYLFSNEAHRLDLRTGNVVVLRYNPVVNPNFQRIQYIAEDAEGYVWMSTFVHTGKYQVQKDSLVLLETFGVLEGMISAGALEMHIDHTGHVWAFTNSGMNVIDPQTGDIRFFGTKEGLPYPYLDPRQVISTSDGRIATVCHNGIIVFDPVKLWNSGEPQNEPVVIKRMRINGQEISSGISANHIRTLDLKHNNNGFDIEFQALAYPTDYKMEYSYRILGLLDSWIPIGRNQLITLPSLAPGEYTFEIKAGNPKSPSPVKSLQIFVETPIYQKGWFIVLVMLLLIMAIYIFLRYRIHHIRSQEEKRTAINKKMADLELKALRSQMNPHFMFNSLNSIKGYILQAEPRLAAEYLSDFAHLIRMILQNSREKSITLQEELETLLLYIELEQIRFDNKFEYSCVIDDVIQPEQVMIPPMLLLPFVENAIWHGLMHKKEKGHLQLRFESENGMVACVIEDDGVGRARAAELKSLSANKYKSMGMGITQDRIMIMNKMDALGITTEITDKHDEYGHAEGTRITVRIPGPSPN